MENTEKFLKALSHEKRLRILKMLEKKNLCVCEIAAVFDIRQPTVSRHLKKLKEAGLIEENRNGIFTEYRLIRAPRLDIVWRLLSEKLEDEPAVRADSGKAQKISRYEISKKRAA